MYGPMTYVSRGTSSPQASTPPAKFRAASRGPMMYPTPRYAGLTSGAVNRVAPPVMVDATFGLVLVRSISLLPRSLIFTANVLLGLKTLIAPSRYMKPPNPILAKRILAAFEPCCPALWISDAATDSG